MQLSRWRAKAEPPRGQSIGNGGKVIGKSNASHQFRGQSQPMAVRSRAGNQGSNLAMVCPVDGKPETQNDRAEALPQVSPDQATITKQPGRYLHLKSPIADFQLETSLANRGIPRESGKHFQSLSNEKL